MMLKLMDVEGCFAILDMLLMECGLRLVEAVERDLRVWGLFGAW
jgi:hypothetical protein